MRRTAGWLLMTGVLGLGVLSPVAARAHGGQYRGPIEKVDPRLRAPEDPPPPDTGGPGPVPPDWKPEPPPPPPRESGLSFDSWQFWWQYNKDELLLRAFRGREGPPRPAPETLEREVLPVLRRFARDGRVNFDIQSAALLALARAGSRSDLPWMMEVARNAGKVRHHRVVEESAALALGVLGRGSFGAREVLDGIAADERAKTRSRSFALLALGWSGSEAARDAEHPTIGKRLRTVAEGKHWSRDLHASALLAMGWLGDAAAVPTLLGYLEDGPDGPAPPGRKVRPCIVAALGELGRPGLSGPDSREVIAALEGELHSADRVAGCAAATALGRVAMGSDADGRRECIDLLSGVVAAAVEGDGDVQTANFAIIALGRMAGARRTPGGETVCGDEVHILALEALETPLRSGNGVLRSHAVLALALSSMDGPEEAANPVRARIRAGFSVAHGSCEQRGAFVIALGLLRDREAAPLMAAILEKGLDDDMRGAAAVSLALMGETAAVERIRPHLLNRRNRDSRKDAALACGLLRDRGSVDLLLDVLREDRSDQYTLAAAAVALGRIGDPRCIPGLVEILEDGKGEYTDQTRALAAASLGVLCAPEVPVVPPRLSTDFNYRNWFDAVGEMLTIL